MSVLFLEYPPCSTCKKAKNYLLDKNIDFIDRDITTNNPTKEELSLWYKKSGLPLKRFFNTSGILYREMELKDKLSSMSEDEQLELLSTNGKLVKRPLVVGENYVLIGFKEEQWNEVIK